MSKRIYLVNLPPKVTDAEIHALVSRYGTVRSVQLAAERNSATVEMQVDGEADRAIAALDGVSFGGRNISVR